MIDKTGIYRIINNIDNKVYYGSAAVSFRCRWIVHKSNLMNNKHGNPHLQAAWNKYGHENFEFKIILICEPVDCLYYEQLFLDKYFDNCINCYNICPTADSPLGRKHSEETKLKMSRSQIGNKNTLGHKCSDETRKKMSEANTGVKNSMFGKTHSLDAKRKISLATSGDKNPMFGRTHSPEAIEKMRSIKIGKVPSVGTREKMSLAHTGKSASIETKEKMRQSQTGKKHSEKTKRKISETKRRKFLERRE